MAKQRKDSIDRFVEGAVLLFPTLEPEVEAAVDRIMKITKYLDRLEERGLIARERDPDDRRSVLVSITPHGEDVVGQAVQQQAKKESDFLDALKPEEQRRLNTFLRSLILEIEDRGELASLHGSGPDQSEE